MGFNMRVQSKDGSFGELLELNLHWYYEFWFGERLEGASLSVSYLIAFQCSCIAISGREFGSSKLPLSVSWFTVCKWVEGF